MALLDFLLKPAKNKLQKAVYQYWLNSGQANIMPDNADAYIEQGYMGNAGVYSILTRIDQMRKQAELKLYRKLSYGEYEEVTDHELLRFKQKINSYTTTNELITALLIYRLTLGEFFIYMPRLQGGVNKGKVPEFFIMPGNETEIIEGTIFDPVKGYRIEGSVDVMFEKEEVYHNKMFNPNWGRDRSLHGLSPLRAASRTVSKQNQIEVTELKQFENQGAPYILYREGDGNFQTQRLTSEQRDDVAKQVKNASRESNRGLPLILREKYGVINLGNKLADLNVIESSRDGLRTLCNIYGFPVDLMNDPAGSTYNNKSTARKAAWTDCIIPNLKEIEETFNYVTIYGVEAFEKDNLFWKFDTNQIEELQDGIETMVNWMVKAKWTGNEIRKATGKEPVDNPLMDEPIINMGETFLSDFGIDLGLEKDFGDYEKRD
jgi:HK97 family phage portal protein